MRAQLLPPLPSGGAPSTTRGYLGQPHRLPMHPARNSSHLNREHVIGRRQTRRSALQDTHAFEPINRHFENGGGNDDENLTPSPCSHAHCIRSDRTSRSADIAAVVLCQPPARDEQWRYRPRHVTQHLRALRPERKRMPRRTVPRTGMGAKLEQPAMLHRLSVQRQFRRLLAVTASTH